MTAQINDRVFHRMIRYSVAGVSGKGLFDPMDYGIPVEVFSTACWRGFHADYEVRESMLLLTSVTIGLSLEHQAMAVRGELPFAPGVVPSPSDRFEQHFEELALPVPYTGGLLVADDFRPELYVHMGFQPAWKYADVRELIFEQGRITEDHDRSQQMAEVRERLKSEPLQPNSSREKDVTSWIECCFSRNYSR